ncbi:N-acetyltransferase [Pseudactinotalea sp.]|uniref:N-acetyltransferase n=1 Tax=Pseudactinotalea sp. TaxID=1926260 RepID=UPI003B3B0011
MPFQNPQLTAPSLLTTETFTLRPITTDDAAIDHAAVMETKDDLRVWEQTGWPEEGFTVESNREDLVGMQQRHETGAAFSYTVLDPTGTTCLGCVYVMPHDATFLAKSDVTPVGTDRWEDVDAATYFWVRTSALAAGTDRTLLDALRTWFDHEWDLGPRVFVTHEDFAQQVALLERTDLTVRFHIVEPGKPGRYLAYG